MHEGSANKDGGYLGFCKNLSFFKVCLLSLYGGHGCCISLLQPCPNLLLSPVAILCLLPDMVAVTPCLCPSCQKSSKQGWKG